MQKRIFGSQKDRFQQINVQSQNCYEICLCVQVVPSGRASIKSNQVEKKKKERKKRKEEEDIKLNPCNQFSHEENFLAIAISSISSFLACSSSSDLFF